MTNGIAIGIALVLGVAVGWWSLIWVVIGGVTIWLIKGKPDRTLFLVSVIAACVGLVRSHSIDQPNSDPAYELSTSAEGEVASFPLISGENERFLFRVDSLCIGQSCSDVSTVVVVFAPSDTGAISRGTRLSLEWSLSLVASLPSGYGSWVNSQGAVGSARARSVEVIEPGPSFFDQLTRFNRHISTSLQSLLPGDTGALASGIVTGDDSKISEEMEVAFLVLGVSHVTSVSGQNVSLIMGFMSLWIKPKRRKARLAFHIVLIASVWMFALVVGFEPPAVRAALVATLMVIGRHVGRKPDTLTILALATGLLALMSPQSTQTVGFWLSVVASFALCLTVPNRLGSRARANVGRILLSTSVASIATLPIVLATFGQWSPMSIVANALLGPALTLTFPVTYALALVSVVVQPLSPILAVFAGIMLDGCLVIVRNLAPYAAQVQEPDLSRLTMWLMYIPITAAIWLLSNESDRWIRRLVARW